MLDEHEESKGPIDDGIKKLDEYIKSKTNEYSNLQEEDLYEENDLNEIERKMSISSKASTNSAHSTDSTRGLRQV